MVEFARALQRPFADWKKLVIGTIVSMVPIVNIALTGYALECAARASSRDWSLPSWRTFGQHWIRGLLVAVAYLVWALIPLVVGLLGLVFLPIMFVGMILFALFAYAASAAIIAYGVEDNFKAAFDYKNAFRVAFTGKWLVAILLTALISTVLGGIAVAVIWVSQANPVLLYTAGGIIGGLTSWIASIASFTIMGAAYGELQGGIGISIKSIKPVKIKPFKKRRR